MNAARWEAAWEEYIDALRQFDGTYPTRHKRSCVRQHNASKKRLGEARKTLTRLDPEFMERNGWK